MRLRLALFTTAAMLLSVLSTAAAPSSQAGARTTISGVVVDTTGGAVRGAKVSLRLLDGSEHDTVTDAAGQFRFENVTADPATIHISVAGFGPRSVDVSRAQAQVHVVLEPLSVSEQITVYGARLTENNITSATKTQTPLRDVPQSVTVVTRELMTEQSMQSLADVARYVPGMAMAQGEGNRDAAVIRGNASTSDFFVDGVRDDVQYFRDLYNVDRIEALKGPNAMIFGRGGGGGVINRVTRQAEWASPREATFQAGSWGNRRLTGDFGQPFSQSSAMRFTGVYENSDSYRRGVGLERYGINPTAVFLLNQNTLLRAGYEFFHDDRTADRGVPSRGGRPVATDASTFFGNPDISTSRATVNAVTTVLEHKLRGGLTFRNRSSFAAYDKFYQNVYPGNAVDAAGTVGISAYNDTTRRNNLFNQTDVIFSTTAGAMAHRLLAGVELGRQATDNFRNTGYFTSISPTITSITVPVTNPTTSLPVTFRPGPTDADNHGIATVAALYVQDQVEFSHHVQAILGLRYDRFDVDFENNRTTAAFASRDRFVSPRLGFVYKPTEPLSLYTTYSMSYLPRAGEQLSSLTLSNQALDPEEFRNYEVGAKWDIRPALALATAVYRLDRTNVAVPDPLDSTRSLLVDGQRTYGFELGSTGNVTEAWSLAVAYAYQDSQITRTLSPSVRAGARISQVPAHTLSLWNKYDVTGIWSLGLGVIHRTDMFPSPDNTVTVPGFARIDAAVFVRLNAHMRAQVNLENLLDEKYYLSAHNNNNITPGSPRAVRVALSIR